jgi:hypothetical protein
MTYRSHSDRISHLRVLNRQLEYVRTCTAAIATLLPLEESWADAHDCPPENETVIDALQQLQADLFQVNLDKALKALDVVLHPAGRKQA